MTLQNRVGTLVRSRVTSHNAGDVVYKEKAITGTEAVPHTYFVLWIHRVKPGSNRKYICTDHSAFCVPGHGDSYCPSRKCGAVDCDESNLASVIHE
jgi:hypothetical protein